MTAFGWTCETLQQPAPSLYVSTPLVMPNGKPFDFYLEDRGEEVGFSDDGLTLFGLRGLGYTLDDGRHLRGMSNIAEDLGFTLDDSGAFVAAFRSADLRAWGAKIIRLFSRILDWEIEHFQSSDADQSLTLEVERLMRRKHPELLIITGPAIRLLNGDDVHFHFKWGEQYVDALPPTARAVSFRLRKAIQVQRAGVDSDSLLFIVDDREQQLREAAARELGILSQVARAVRMSDFARAA